MVVWCFVIGVLWFVLVGGGVGVGGGSGNDDVGGALEVVLGAAVVLWLVMVGDGGVDEKRKSIPGSG